MKSVLSILFYLFFCAKLFAQENVKYYYCDSIDKKINNWAYVFIPNEYDRGNILTEENRGNDKHYYEYDYSLLRKFDLYQKDTIRTIGIYSKCPIPQYINTILYSSEYSSEEEIKYPINTSNINKITNVSIEDFSSDTLFLFNVINEIAKLDSLKTLKIILYKRFSTPTNIAKLKEIEWLYIEIDSRFFYSNDRSDTLFFNNKIVTNRNNQSENDFFKNYFIYNVEDGYFELKNLKYFSINTFGSININNTNLSKLEKLEAVSFTADSVFYLKEDLFSKNNVKHINLFWNRPEYIIRMFGGSKNKENKIGFFHDFPRCLISAKHSLNQFDCNYIKLDKNADDLAELVNLKSLNSDMFTELDSYPFCFYKKVSKIEEFTFYSYKFYKQPTKLGVVRFNNLKKFVLVGKYPERTKKNKDKGHFLKYINFLYPPLKNITLVNFEGDITLFSQLYDNKKKITLEFVNTDLNKLLDRIPRTEIRNYAYSEFPKFSKVIVSYEDIIGCSLSNLIKLNCDTLELVFNKRQHTPLQSDYYSWINYKKSDEFIWDQISLKLESGQNTQLPVMLVQILNQLPNVKVFVVNKIESNKYIPCLDYYLVKQK